MHKQLTNHASQNGDYVYMAYARGLLDFLSEKNLDVHKLLMSCDIDPSLIDDAQAVLSSEQYSQLWERSEELSGDAQLGLHVGEIVRPGKYGILGYAMMSSSNLQDALERQRRYQDLVGKAGRSELICKDGLATLQWESPLALRSHHISEEHLASWMAFAQTMLGTGKHAISASFVHAQPDNIKEHQRIFGCELLFSQPRTSISFSREYLSISLREKNPGLQEILDAHAEQLLQQLTPTDNHAIDEVRRNISEQLLEGTPTIEQVAEQLGTSARSLQRQLSAAGWSYKSLLDEVRKTLAIEYIRDGQLSMLDIAFALGFSEQSPFQRAFKRWTGQTPGQYRNRMKG